MPILDLLIKRIETLNTQSHDELPIEWVDRAIKIAALEEKRQTQDVEIDDSDADYPT